MATYRAKSVMNLGRNCCRFRGILRPLNHSRITPIIVVRHHARWFRPMLLSLQGWIKSIDFWYGPEPLKPRSAKENWNYESELFAFGKRLGEEFNELTIRTAFTDQSHIQGVENTESKGKDVKLPAEHNQLLVQMGEIFLTDYIKTYFKLIYPRLPDEGISGVLDYLTSENVLVHLARNLGMKDLILCSEFPVPDEVLHKTFLAVVGAINKDQGLERAGQFVCDFVIAQLVNQDLGALCQYSDPMGLLIDILKKEDRGPPEARLLRQTGQNTVMGVFMVGIYSDQKLLGWAPGDSLASAEEEATRVALKNYFGTTENTPPLPLDQKTRTINSQVIRSLQQEVNQRISASQ